MSRKRLAPRTGSATQPRGGVAVAYHRLHDFRSDHGDVFSELVTQLLARLMKHDPSISIASPRTAPHSRLRRRCVVSKR